MQKLPKNNLTGYKKLIVFQKSRKLVLWVYKATKSFPKEEVYALTSRNELEFHLELSVDLGYLKEYVFVKINDLLIEVKKLLYAYQKSLRT